MLRIQGWPYVLVVATSDIEEGEELQIDYGEQVLCLGPVLLLSWTRVLYIWNI